jgi:ATP-dependent DNA helicase RecQ
VADSSKARLAERQSWERALLDWMEEQSPDAGPDEPREINLRAACQELRDRGENGCTPQEIRLIFKLHAQAALLRWRKRGDNRYALSFSVDWAELRRRVEQRRLVCRVLLDELVRRVPKGRQGKDILVSFQKGDLERALRDDLQTRELPGVSRLIEQGLLALHELNAVTLQNGLSVFRAAMTLRVRPDGERFKKEEFRPLEEFFERKIVQVHIMSRFAELAADAVKAALVLVRDYFLHPGAQFLARHFQGQEWMLKLPTTAQSYARIVDSLDPVQREAVEAGDDNVLINAGPGSGKTRVVVRRIAWLVRVRRVSPRSILALAFNRSAAGQIRKRLRELIGGDAGWVRVSTYHALAMSITGRTLMGRRPQAGDEFFTGVLEEAVQLMEKAAQGGGELVDWRDRLLSGLRYILVDEYQDVNELEYRFLSLLAGRTEDRERRPALMAVGDDDQNIYAWAGANAAFIRRFEADYGARVLWLTRNHRSAPAVVDAANRLIRSNRGRMKTGRDMASAAFGGSPGRVRFFLARDEASMLKTALELAREAVDSGVPPEGVCVLCRTNRELDALERLAGAMGLPAKPIRARREPLTSTREFLLLKACLEACGRIRLRGNRLQSLVHELVRDSGYRSDNPWMGRVLMLLDLYLAETGGGARRVQDFLLFLYDASRELAREARPEAGLIGLMTMHSAKGLEFEAVVAAGQPRTPRSQDLDDERRLFYVAATRARERLDVLARRDAPHPFQEEMAGDSPPIPAHARLNEAETTAYATRWLELGLADVVISWPALEGVCARAQPVLARLEPGDRQGLAICRQGRNWLIQAWETPVAKLSQAGAGRLRTLMDDGYVPLGVEHTAGVVWEAREQDGEADVRPPAMERWLVGLFRIELRRPTA